MEIQKTYLKTIYCEKKRFSIQSYFARMQCFLAISERFTLHTALHFPDKYMLISLNLLCWQLFKKRRKMEKSPGTLKIAYNDFSQRTFNVYFSMRKNNTNYAISLSGMILSFIRRFLCWNSRSSYRS